MKRNYNLQKLMIAMLLSVISTGSLLAEVNLTDTLDRSGWTVLSVDNEGEAKEGAIDGDPATRWATTWGDDATPMPHYITIDLGDVYEISELVYQPRQDEWGPNGTIINYTVCVGSSIADFDNTASWFAPHREQFSVKGSIAWAEDTDTEGFKAMMVMPMERALMGRYLRVYCDSAVNGEPETIIAELWAKGKMVLNTTNMIPQKYHRAISADDFHNPIEMSVDGDWGTGWNTEWEPETPMPHELVIDLGGEFDLDSLLYVSRQDVWGPNGTIVNYDLFVSNDTTTWGDVEKSDSIQWFDIFPAANAFDSSQIHKNPMMIALDSVATGRYLKIVSKGQDLGGKQQMVVNELFTYGKKTATPTKPVADAGDDQSVIMGDKVMLSGGNSYDVDGDELTFAWTSLNTDITLDDATTASPTFTAPDVTETTMFKFSLVVNDGTSDSEADMVTITVNKPNVAPVAMAGEDQSVDETTDGVATVVTLGGGASYDPDGGDITFLWTSLSTDITLDDPTTVSPTFTCPDVTEVTTFTFSLVVNDGDLDSEADEVVITVNPVLSVTDEVMSIVKVYPNPSEGIFTVEMEEATTVRVVNMLGKIVAVEDFYPGKNTLDLTGLNKGVYVLATNKKSMLIQVK